MNETRNDNGYKQFPFRVFSLLLIAIMPAVFASSMFYACVSEREKTVAVSHGLPADDRHYYYLPDYETYYYPPNRQWIYYDQKTDEWLVSRTLPEKLNDTDLKNIYMVRLDYEGFTPYELNATHKIKYPPSRRLKQPSPEDPAGKTKKRAD